MAQSKAWLASDCPAKTWTFASVKLLAVPGSPANPSPALWNPLAFSKPQGIFTVAPAVRLEQSELMLLFAARKASSETPWLCAMPAQVSPGLTV